MSVVVPLGPAGVDITGARAGDRNLMTITLTTKGEPYDLTDAVVTAQARAKSTDADPAITAVINVTDAPGGVLELTWPGEQVLTALGGKASWSGVWDLQVAYAESDPITVCAGKFGAVMDVTR